MNSASTVSECLIRGELKEERIGDVVYPSFTLPIWLLWSDREAEDCMQLYLGGHNFIFHIFRGWKFGMIGHSAGLEDDQRFRETPPLSIEDL